MSGAARLRALLAASETIAAPGVIDPLSARLVERLGFGALYLGGHSMGVHLGEGQPLTTMTEAVAVAARVGAETSAPLILDGGAGFGDPAHVDRFVREAERAGVAAVHIEDQPYPKRPGYHRGEGELATVETTVAKLRAALGARRETLVLARTDALRVSGSVAETLDRCAAFAAAGVDGLIVLDLEPPLLAEIAARLPDLPLLWIGGVADPGPSLAEMADAGFAAALYPFNTVAAIVDSLAATWSPLAERGRLEQPAELLARARAEALELTRIPRAWEVEAAAREERADD
jgi:2-methylisocitrate lyase-like PEP mutase family enzyme